MKVLEPWLDSDYIRKIFVAKQDHLVLFFSDGGQRDYVLDDCSKAQLKEILNDMIERGITVERAQYLV